jgi:hypothetical protein
MESKANKFIMKKGGNPKGSKANKGGIKYIITQTGLQGYPRG